MSFSEHMEIFKVMLSIDLEVDDGWYMRSRLWNLVYLQLANGSFEPSPDFAQTCWADDSASTDRDNPKRFNPEALLRGMPLCLTPEGAASLGLDRPVAQVTLLQVDGEPIELVVGRPGSSGSTFVWNKATDTLCLLTEDDVRLLLPTVDDLCSTDLENPWEAWLPR